MVEEVVGMRPGVLTVGQVVERVLLESWLS